MIAATRFNGVEIYVNPDLILTIEETPDTMLTMTTGEKLIVRERAEALIERIREYKRSIYLKSAEIST